MSVYSRFVSWVRQQWVSLVGTITSIAGFIWNYIRPTKFLLGGQSAVGGSTSYGIAIPLSALAFVLLAASIAYYFYHRKKKRGRR